MTPKEIRRTKRIRKEYRRIITAYIILVALVLVAFVVIIGNQYDSAIMQIDTLDQINDLRQEIEQKEPVLGDVDKVVETEEKTGNGAISSSYLTEQERDLVCRIVSAESRGEDLQSQMAVAQVIKDRAELWGMTPTEVVTAPYQFAKPYKGEISDKTYLAVANVFDGNMRVFEGDTTHFHDDSSNPYWADSKTSRGDIGRLKFYGGNNAD